MKFENILLTVAVGLLVLNFVWIFLKKKILEYLELII